MGLGATIGGTAATLALEEAGLEFRATKDLDIVLHVEALTPRFGEVFWRFIDAGGYEIRQVADTGRPVFSDHPSNPAHELLPWAVAHAIGAARTPFDQASARQDGRLRNMATTQRFIDYRPAVFKAAVELI